MAEFSGPHAGGTELRDDGASIGAGWEERLSYPSSRPDERRLFDRGGRRLVGTGVDDDNETERAEVGTRLCGGDGIDYQPLRPARVPGGVVTHGVVSAIVGQGVGEEDPSRKDRRAHDRPPEGGGGVVLRDLCHRLVESLNALRVQEVGELDREDDDGELTLHRPSVGVLAGRGGEGYQQQEGGQKEGGERAEGPHYSTSKGNSLPLES